MSLIKRKLSSKAGASMLLAMVFLMFCLFIGGSVLAAATANGSRVDHLKNDQQDYLSQRSAMLLMSDMLLSDSGKELQLTITDVTVVKEGEETPTRTVTFTSNAGSSPSILQKMLFEIIVGNYISTGTNINCDKLYITKPTSTVAANGTITVAVTIDSSTETLNTTYAVDSSDYSLSVDFDPNPFVSLTMDGSVGESTEKIVTIGNTAATTKTTVIRWSLPVLEKRGA